MWVELPKLTTEEHFENSWMIGATYKLDEFIAQCQQISASDRYTLLTDQYWDKGYGSYWIFMRDNITNELYYIGESNGDNIFGMFYCIHKGDIYYGFSSNMVEYSITKINLESFNRWKWPGGENIYPDEMWSVGRDDKAKQNFKKIFIDVTGVPEDAVIEIEL